jgi:hypothetical protein
MKVLNPDINSIIEAGKRKVRKYLQNFVLKG